MNMTASITDLPDLLLTLDEFRRLRGAADFYAAEASRCFHGSVHPYLSGCMHASSAIHAVLQLTVHLRAEAIDNIGILPRARSSFTPIFSWSMSEVVRVSGYMAWFPRPCTLDTKINITRLCHVHELLEPKLLARAFSDDRTDGTYWKKLWQRELKSWQGIYKSLNREIKNESRKWIKKATREQDEVLATSCHPVASDHVRVVRIGA